MRLDDLDEGPVNFLKNVGAGIKAGVAGYQASKAANLPKMPDADVFQKRKDYWASQRAQQQAAQPQTQAPAQSQTQYGAMKPTSVSAKMGAAPGQAAQKPAGGQATATWGGGGQLAYSTTVGGKPAAAAPAGTSVPAAGNKDATATPTATPSAKPRINIGRAATGAPQEKPAAAGAADFETLKKTVSGLSKREQQKILTQLLSSLGTPVTR